VPWATAGSAARKLIATTSGPLDATATRLLRSAKTWSSTLGADQLWMGEDYVLVAMYYERESKNDELIWYKLADGSEFRGHRSEMEANSSKEMVDAIIVDIHGEATSEKQAMGHFCDGRVSLVAGTHTHAPTADHQILPNGTAFVSDVGMSGDYNSVIGMDKDEPLTRFVRKIPGARFEPATGEATLCALAVETDDASGLALRVGAVRLGGRLEPVRPRFWE